MRSFTLLPSFGKVPIPSAAVSFALVPAARKVPFPAAAVAELGKGGEAGGTVDISVERFLREVAELVAKVVGVDAGELRKGEDKLCNNSPNMLAWIVIVIVLYDIKQL